MKAKPVFLFTALAGATGLALISLASSSDALAASKTKQYTRTFTVDAVGFLDPRPEIVNVPTMGVVELLACFNSPNFSMRTRIHAFEDAQPFFGVGTVTGSDLPVGVGGVVSDQTGGIYQTGRGEPLIAHLFSNGDLAATAGTVGHWEFSLWRNNGDNKRGAHVSIDGYNDPTGKCHFRATVLQND